MLVLMRLYVPFCDVERYRLKPASRSKSFCVQVRFTRPSPPVAWRFMDSVPEVMISKRKRPASSPVTSQGSSAATAPATRMSW